MNDENVLGILIRTGQTNGQQACDDVCARWNGLPHPHLHFDGLYNEHSPLLTLGGFCSCGVEFDPMVEYNVDTTAGHIAASQHGLRQIERFKMHMRKAHAIDLDLDGPSAEEWREIATRLP